MGVRGGGPFREALHLHGDTPGAGGIPEMCGIEQEPLHRPGFPLPGDPKRYDRFGRDPQSACERKVLKICILCAFVIALSAIAVWAANANEIDLVPTDDQYFELRAVEVKEVAGQNKQVIMELWGNNIEFKRI